MCVLPCCGALCDDLNIKCVMPCVVWWCGGGGASPGEAGTQDDGEGTVGIISCHNACQFFSSDPDFLVWSVPSLV